MDFAEDMRLEVALTELGEHLEFDRENFHVKDATTKCISQTTTTAIRRSSR